MPREPMSKDIMHFEPPYTTTRMTTTTTISDGKFYNFTNTIFAVSYTKS